MNFLHRINSWLATAIATLNAVLALLIVGFTALGMAVLLGSVDDEASAAVRIVLGLVGFVVGALLGVVIAIAVCGVIAVLLDIRQVLIDTRDRIS